jgi:dTDP-4-dehydrorhamnose reductase
MFNLIRPNGNGYDAKRHIPDLTTRQLDRDHQQLRRDQDEWIQRTWTTDVSAVEHQLVSVGIDRRVAAIAAESVITPTSS